MDRAGGKIVTNRRLDVTPYDRPPLPLSPIPLAPPWFTGLIIPSFFSLASGAGKILSTFFVSSTSEDDDSDSDFFCFSLSPSSSLSCCLIEDDDREGPEVVNVSNKLEHGESIVMKVLNEVQESDGPQDVDISETETAAEIIEGSEEKACDDTVAKIEPSVSIFLDYCVAKYNPTTKRDSRLVKPTCSLPINDSAGKASCARMTVVCDNKENIESVSNLAFTKEKVKLSKNTAENTRLDGLSIRKLRKMLREKQEITKKLSQNENGKEARAGPALAGTY